MLKKCLEEIVGKYVINFHYSPELHEFDISIVKAGGIGKFVSASLPAKYLSDDKKIVEEIKGLIARLEE